LVFAAVRPGSAAELPSAGLWLNASKSESMPERDDVLGRRRTRIRIGFGLEPLSPTPARWKCASARVHGNFTARPDETLADDLDARPGRVSSRVALLLRAAERKPASATFVETPPPHQRVVPSNSRRMEGGSGLGQHARPGGLPWGWVNPRREAAGQLTWQSRVTPRPGDGESSYPPGRTGHPWAGEGGRKPCEAGSPPLWRQWVLYSWSN
jgi:hypothetical protein